MKPIGDRSGQFASSFLLLVCVALLLFCVSTLPLDAQQSITVTSANPNNAAQDTINLNVLINGKGFKKGALAKFFISGTTDSGGVSVNSTTFINSGQLNANINVAGNAAVTSFDIVVALTDGRSGKGTQLFNVTVKGSAICSPTPVLASVTSCYLMAPGCLDATFGVNGKVLTNTSGSVPSSTDIDEGYAISIQPDGSIIAMGHSDNSANGTGIDFAVVKYLPDGSVDTTFGTGGVAKVSFTTVWRDTVWDGLVQPDGKILVVGSAPTGSNSSDQMAIVRFNPDGTLDATFGVGGKLIVSATTAAALAVALQSDGKIVLAGGSSLVRLNLNGSLDSGFGSGGLVTLTPKGGMTAYALAIQSVAIGGGSEERILVAGGTSPRNGEDFALLRVTPTGAVDNSFGPNLNGITSTDFCGSTDRVRRIALDASGNILTTGLVYASGGFSGSNFGLARYTPNGILDTSFGSLGKNITDLLGFADSAYGLAVQPDGKSIVSGWSFDSAGSVYFTVARYNPNGSLDSTFGSAGAVATDFASVSNYGHRLALQVDGKIVVVGTVDANGGYNFALARYWP